jgi:hypothetical protein
MKSTYKPNSFKRKGCAIREGMALSIIAYECPDRFVQKVSALPRFALYRNRIWENASKTLCGKRVPGMQRIAYPTYHPQELDFASDMRF